SHRLPGRAARDVAQRGLRVTDPAVGVGSLRRAGEERAQVLGRLLHVAPLEQQECHAVVRTHQGFVQLEGPLVMADGLFGLAGLGEGDRHVQQDARVGRIVPKREPVRREGGFEVPLPLEREPLVQVVQPLRTQRLARPLAEQAVPEAHDGGGLSEQSRTGTTFWTPAKIVRGRRRRNADGGPARGSGVGCWRGGTGVGWGEPDRRLLMRRSVPSGPRGVLEVDWPFFGEICRALALRVARDYQPEIVLGVAKAGVIPGVVVASIMQCEFSSMTVTRREDGASPVLVSGPPATIRGRRILVVDETCDTGSTMRLALSEVRGLRPAEVRSAVSFKTGEYAPTTTPSRPRASSSCRGTARSSRAGS